jgi:hypothetical protein
MSAATAIKDMTWSGSLPGDAAEFAQTLVEIKECLGEIRDLQKAHFERYKEFTAQIVAGEKERTHQAQQSYIDQLRCQEEMRKTAFQRQLIGWAVWGAIVVFVMVAMFLFQFIEFM